MSDYKPGQVARATVRGVPDVLVARTSDQMPWIRLDGPAVGSLWLLDEHLTDVRPLILLDLGDDAADVVEYLKVATDGFDKAAYGMEAWGGRGPLRKIADQIEKQTKPPRMDEPGWGSIVVAHTKANLTRRRILRTGGGVWEDEDGRGHMWSDLIDPEPWDGGAS